MNDKYSGLRRVPVSDGHTNGRAAAHAGNGLVSKESEPRTGTDLVRRLRCIAIRSLAQMYRQDEKLFVFRVRRTAGGIVPQGLSRRYTAVALIGLSREEDAEVFSVLGDAGLHGVCGRLIGDVPRLENLGDVALILWAASAVKYPERRWAWERLLQFEPARGAHPTVEIAWALDALCRDPEAPVGDLRERLARRLIADFDKDTGIFPHVVGRNGTAFRSHVSCFADLVYPIHALAQYFRLSGDREALDVASRCAKQICRLQGPAGQWWWHYDRRTGNVIEPYPVYAVHQDAMAPMALFGVEEATAITFDAEIGKGLDWLARAPELGGGSLIDEPVGLIWRKVARREPAKFSRYAQALASRLHTDLRVPGLDMILPPRAVDYEDRPYHLGWLLHAWPATRLARWESAARSGQAVGSR